MKKTKIICTLGPNVDDYNLFLKLSEYMDVARFNFSHGDYKEHLGRLENLKKIRRDTGKQIAALLDTKGPEIRTGKLENGQKFHLNNGDEFILTIDEIVGNKNKVFINYKDLINDIHIGDSILIDDGLIELEVTKIDNNDIICKVVSGGELGEKKGVNIPNVKINLPDLTDKDIEDIKFGIEAGFDIIAASFVRSANCIKQIKNILKQYNSNMLVIAKIENYEGLQNLDDIINESDGIMVARGDLGVEVDPTMIPRLQKEIIKKCNAKGKVVITATQMLDSMIRNIRPTRAEINDVANAIYDGTDVVMLSGETANGQHPIEAAKIMSEICEVTENHIGYRERREKLFLTQVNYTITNTISKEAVYCAEILHAKAIITPTETGNTARVISKYKPTVPIYALSSDETVVRKMMIYFAVTPLLLDNENNTDVLLDNCKDLLKEKKYIDENDLVVLAFRTFYKQNAMHTNAIRVEQII